MTSQWKMGRQEYPPDDEIARFIAKKLMEGKRVAVATIIEKRGSAPRGEGSKLVVAQDGDVIGTIGGGEAERLIEKEALEALSNGQPRTIKVSLYRDSLLENVKSTSQLCGGVITVFIDVLKPRQRTIIVGAGHMARALSHVMSFLGHQVIIVDNYPQHATKDKLPDADTIIVDKNPAEALVNKIRPRTDDIILIVHGDGDLEAEVISKILENTRGIKYLGLLSGKGKLNYIIRKLLERGLDSRLIAESLVSPIGMAIKSETPEEIAIAVASEIICRERKGPEKCASENLVPMLVEKALEKKAIEITSA